MSDIYFKCECGKSLAVDDAGIGRTVPCVDCGKLVTVPDPELEFSCEGCRETLLAPSSVTGDLIKCASCGHRMTVPSVVMNSLMRRRTCGAFRANEFTIRRRPPRQGMFADAKLSVRLFRVAVAALAVVALAEVMRGFLKDCGSAPDELTGMSTSQETGQSRSPELTACAAGMPHDKPGTSHHGAQAHHGGQAGDSAPEDAVREIKDETLVCEQQPDNDFTSHDAIPGSEIPRSEVSVPAPPVLIAASTAEPDEELPLIAESDAEPGKPDVPANGKGEFRLMDKVIATCESIKKDRSVFDRLVPRLWSELIEYTSTHSGRALDEKDWESAFRIAGEMVLDDPALTYEHSLAHVEQGVHVLRTARPENKQIAVRLAMCLAMTHADRWRRSNLQANATIIDDMWEWARSLDDPALRRSCLLRTMFFEGNLINNRFSVSEDERDIFIREREQKLWVLLDDEALSLELRTVALSHWASALQRCGRTRDVITALEIWRERHGENIVSARYYRALFETSLFGMGDWDMARRALREASRQRNRWTTSYDQAVFADICRMYYDSMLFNGYELMRAGSERRQEHERELRMLAANTAGRKS